MLDLAGGSLYAALASKNAPAFMASVQAFLDRFQAKIKGALPLHGDAVFSSLANPNKTAAFIARLDTFLTKNYASLVKRKGCTDTINVTMLNALATTAGDEYLAALAEYAEAVKENDTQGTTLAKLATKPPRDKFMERRKRKRTAEAEQGE
jgi:hypothetical protein